MASRMRSVLQADPDVIMIGELREAESVQMALRLGLTGHLVLTQLHAESAVHALLRLIEVSGSVYTLTEAVRLILNQRLLRRLCPPCRTQEAITAEEQNRFAPLFERLDLPLGQLREIPQARGCQHCQQTGYRGRLQITEALSMSPALSRLLHQGAWQEEIQTHLHQQGWRSYLHDGLERVLAGETNLVELARVAGLL